MGRFLIIVSTLTVIVLYLLSVSSYAETLSSQFKVLSALSSALVLFLLFALVRRLWKLKQDVKAQVLGAKLNQRLVRMFVWVALLPGLAILMIASYFIKTSIDSWFSDEITQSLNRSVDLSKNLLQEFQEDTRKSVLLWQEEWHNAQKSNSSIQAFIDHNEQSQQFYQIIIFNTTDHTPIAYGGYAHVIDHLPDSTLFPPEQQITTDTVNIGNEIYAQVWLPYSPAQQPHWILFRQPIPSEIAHDILYIETARSHYAQSTYNKNGVQALFLISLVMATLLAMVLALLIALYFARRFVAPLASLAQATNAVAQGDFTRRAAVYREDELGILSARFNRMVGQLHSAQITTEQMHIQQEQARRHLELVLSTLSSGVMTLDEDGRLKTCNDGAKRILDFPLNELIGTAQNNWQQTPQHKEIAAFIQHLMNNLQQTQAMELEYHAAHTTRILMGRAVLLPNHRDTLLVFDDVTDLASAQKEAAWGEVARRLAHEIKNPLTPIRLSAERLAMKLTDKLNDTDANMLIRSTNTIINQVDALYELVEGFRNYARSGNLKLEKVDFTQIVDEILVLYEHSVQYHLHIKRYPEPLFIRADNTAMRQVLHNLFKNAVEAAVESDNPQI